MSRRLTVVALAVAVLAAGCGGSKALSKTELVKKADAVCKDTRKRVVEEIGLLPLSPAAVAAADEKLLSIQRKADRKLEDLKPPKDVKSAWKRYLDARAKGASLTRREQEAARKRDQRALQAIGAEQETAARERFAAAQALGLRICANPGDRVDLLGPPEPGSGPPSGLSYPKPAAPLKTAVAELQRAAASGNCDALRGLQNSDDQKIPQQSCAPVLAALHGMKVLATDDFGPVALVDIVNDMGRQSTVGLVLDAKDRKLRLGPIVSIEGGAVHPAPSDNDAQRNIDAAVEAIRADDGAALHKVVSEQFDVFDKQGPRVDLSNPTGSGPRLVKAIRADKNAKPELLGADQAFAFFLLNADKTPYLLVAPHGPTGYKLGGYYPLPAA